MTTKKKQIQHDQPIPRIKMKDFLKQWDVASKKQRTFILQRFSHHFGNEAANRGISTAQANNLVAELGAIAPLFFSRIVCSFQINHMKQDLILLHLECIFIYLQCQQSKHYLQRFVNAGGIQLTLHVLQHRPRHNRQNYDIEWKCLLILQRAIKLSSHLKELICMNEGIPLLLSVCLNVPSSFVQLQDLLYLLYDILKQLCIRNSAYRAYIHERILDNLDIDQCCESSLVNADAIKILLQVLQNTLILDDDSEPVAIQKTHISSLLKLVKLRRHQLIYELQKLCHILFRSSNLQYALLESILHFVKDEDSISTNDSEDDAAIYNSLLRSLVNENKSVLSAESKQLLADNNIYIHEDNRINTTV